MCESLNSKNVASIIVCSNNYDNLKEISIPFLKKLTDMFIVKIYLDNSTSKEGNLKQLCYQNNIELIKPHVSGLSTLRNIALENCDSKFIIFLDDDLQSTLNSLTQMIGLLESNFHAVGLFLSSPEYVHNSNHFISINQYHYLGLHNASTRNSIWGACMGFKMETIGNNNLSFNETLGRKSGILISGEDTSFVNQIKDLGYQTKLICVNDTYHWVAKSKLTFKYMMKRVFAQGVTEVMRESSYYGFRKELNRNFHHITLHTLLVSPWWIIVYSFGVLYGLIKFK